MSESTVWVRLRDGERCEVSGPYATVEEACGVVGFYCSNQDVASVWVESGESVPAIWERGVGGTWERCTEDGPATVVWVAGVECPGVWLEHEERDGMPTGWGVVGGFWTAEEAEMERVTMLDRSDWMVRVGG